MFHILQWQLLKLRSESTAMAKCSDGVNRRYQMAVAIMDRMEIPAGVPKQHFGGVFARGIADKWGVGDRGCGNGIVLLISRSDRVAYIRTGAQARHHFSDARAAWIIDMMKPYLVEGDVSKATQLGVYLVRRSLEGEDKFSTQGWQGFLFVAIAIGVMFLCCALSAWRERRRQTIEAQRAERALNGIMRDLQADVGRPAAARDLQRNTTCPICLETFAGSPEPSAPTEEEIEAARTASAATTARTNLDGTGAGETSQETSHGLQVRKLRCNHCFHNSCIAEWLRTHTECPLCRADVSRDVPRTCSPPRITPETSSSAVLADNNENSEGRAYRERAAFYATRFAENFPRMMLFAGGMDAIHSLLLAPYRNNRQYFTGDTHEARPFVPTRDAAARLFENIDFSGFRQERVRQFEERNRRNSNSWFGRDDTSFGGARMSEERYGRTGAGGAGGSW